MSNIVIIILTKRCLKIQHKFVNEFLTNFSFFQFESKMKTFIIELYIRALTTDMNHLERQKTDNDKDKISETTKQLADGFTNLAEVLKSDIHVSRECIMTAFSLQPTQERMKKIEELAKLSGFEVLDTGQAWKCKLHPPVLPTDDVTWICNHCGEYMCKPQLNVPLNTTNTALNEALTEEKLGITRELCDDLVVLLSSPRYQVFSWLLNWPDLQRLCLMYLNDPERTKNIVTELKFLDIDYSIFATVKKEPLDEYAGIERGYEHYLDHEFDEDQISNVSEDTGSQDSRFYSVSSDSASELHCLPFGPRKSDPNTLKSLRMFRPNLKRSRTNPETQVPEKKSRNESDSALPSSSKSTFSSGISSVDSILGMNSFVQESSSSSSSPVCSIIGMNSSKQVSPLSSFSTNGFKVEKPFIPIKLHPPQHTNMNSLNLSNKEPINIPTTKSVLQSTMPTKIHTQQNTSMKPLDFVNQKEPNNPAKPLSSYNNVIPTKLYALLQNTKESLDNRHQIKPFGFLDTYSPSSQNNKLVNLHQNSKSELTNQYKCKEPLYSTKLMTGTRNVSPMNLHSSQQPVPVSQKGQSSHLNKFDSSLLLQSYPKSYSNNNLDKTSFSQYETNARTSNNVFCSATQTLLKNFNASSVNDSNSKNGQVATLQQVGGQVAIENGPARELTAQAIIGNPNNSNSSETISTHCNTSNHTLVISSEPTDLPSLESALIKENATAKVPKCLSGTDTMEQGAQNMSPNSDIIKNNTEIITPENISIDHHKDTQNVEDKCKDHLLNVVPNLFQDWELEEPKVETPNQYVQIEIIDVEETKRDTSNLKSYVKKPKLKEKPKFEDFKIDFMLNKNDESIISIDDTSDGYADTLINSDSEYDCFSSTNPILHNVLNKIDSYEKMKLSNMNKESRFIQNTTDASHCDYKTKLLVSKELKYKDTEFKNNRGYLRKEPKYESCPDTGSDSQVELDSDDQYNRCYIELSRNNLLYDTINGVFKNIDHYLKKCNNNNIDFPMKRGKKSKKGCSSKKNRKLKTGNSLDKTALDLDSRNKPKKDVSIRDVKVVLKRLPAELCETYLKKKNVESNNDPIEEKMSSEPQKNLYSKKDEVKNKIMDMKNPKVVLERLSVINNNYVRSVLANVPGLHDTELIRPANTNMVVNVVQMAGGRSNSTVPVVNAQTSTQITPHIQRIGQPRIEKPQGEQIDSSETMVTSTVTSVSSTVKPSTSQPSTLINILSQQVIRPGQSSNCVKTRPTPLINIVSHQIIRPSNQAVSKMITSSAQTNEQVCQDFI